MHINEKRINSNFLKRCGYDLRCDHDFGRQRNHMIEIR